MVTMSLLSCLLLFPGCRMVRLLSIYKSTKQHVEQSVVSGPVEIPFRYEQGWMILMVKIRQGETELSGDFLFDTGAFTELFESCRGITVWHPKKVHKMPVTGALGTSYRDLKIAKKVVLQTGAFIVQKPNLLVAARPSFFPGHWLGIIGADFFHHHILTIDFKKQKLLLHAPGVFPREGISVLKMKTIASYNPVVQQVSLGDLAPRDYLVDAGNEGSVLIQQPDEGSLKQAMGKDTREYAYKQGGAQDGSGKIVASNYYTRTAGSINGFPCPEFEVAGLVNEVSHRKYGNMGLAFIGYVFETITLDFPGNRFYYKIDAHPVPRERFDREVYFLQEDSAFFTGPVLIRSSWYEQGLRPGARVAQINGQPPKVYMRHSKEGRPAPLQSITIAAAGADKVLKLIKP